MTNEDQLRTALHDRLGPLLADLQPAPSLLDDLASRRRRRTYREAVIAAAAVVAIAGVAVFVVQRPFRDNSAVVTPAPTASSQSGAPLPGPTVSRPDTIRVPDVVGLDLSAAITIAKAAGLEVALSAGPSGAVVVAQTPTAGSIVVPGSALKLTLGASPNASATTGAMLPDGSGLPAGCTLPATQDETPPADDVFLGSDSCGVGEFSIADGRLVRYLSSTAYHVHVGPDGAVWFGADATCGHVLTELSPGRRRADVVSSGPKLAFWPLALASGRAAWGDGPCDPTVSTRTSQIVTLVRGSTHALAWERGNGTVGVNSVAISAGGRLAVSFARIDGTTTCPAPADGNDCANVTASGISVVAAAGRTIPDPAMHASAHCSFGAVSWSGASLLAVEECDSSMGPRMDYGGPSRLVRLDPDTGKRLATIELPSPYLAMDIVRGMRTLSTGDVLVAMGSAKVGSHLVRVHGDGATPVDSHGATVGPMP